MWGAETLPDILREDEQHKEEDINALKKKVAELEDRKPLVSSGLQGVNVFGLEINVSTLLLIAVVGLSVYILTKEDNKQRKVSRWPYS